MGNELVAVSDAGPLIHLTEVAGLALLSVFDQLHVPNAVWHETVGQGRVPREELLALGNTQRHSSAEEKVRRFAQQNHLEELHVGERESLYLCRELNVSTVLTDDLAVREVSYQLGVTPVGSLGIVVRACCMGCISPSEAEERITELYDVSSLYVTRAVVEIAVEQLRFYIKGGT
jgi:predicted nucleic acid-binding protein